MEFERRKYVGLLKKMAASNILTILMDVFLGALSLDTHRFVPAVS